MTETAKALAHITGKTIVLVGALAPARFAESDAPFNLGMAVANGLVPVIVAMSGGAIQLPSLQAGTWGLGIGLMLLIGAVVGFLPAWRGMRLNIVDALAGR